LESAVTLQSLLPSLLAPALAERRRSFWRRLLDAIETRRQLKAEQQIRKSLRRHRGDHRDDFTRELGRRLLGQ
jgi:hypothetical protein